MCPWDTTGRSLIPASGIVPLALFCLAALSLVGRGTPARRGKVPWNEVDPLTLIARGMANSPSRVLKRASSDVVGVNSGSDGSEQKTSEHTHEFGSASMNRLRKPVMGPNQGSCATSFSIESRLQSFENDWPNLSIPIIGPLRSTLRVTREKGRMGRGGV
jgi:hypothetical protein